MKDFGGKLAAITGAASGIGRALAVDLARRGARLAISDVDEVGLAETRATCGGAGATVSAAKLDVADRDAVYRYAEQVERDLGGANLVINNAGVAVAGTLRNTKHEDFTWLMNINFWGVVHGSLAFLPQLERAGEGHIVNISSVFGIIAKSARVSSDDGLRSDEIAGTFQRAARTTPEQCAAAVLGAVRRNAPRVLVGVDAHLIDSLQRLAPTGYQRIAKRFAASRWKR